jgi:hypothetical protein
MGDPDLVAALELEEFEQRKWLLRNGGDITWVPDDGSEGPVNTPRLSSPPDAVASRSPRTPRRRSPRTTPRQPVEGPSPLPHDGGDWAAGATGQAARPAAAAAEPHAPNSAAEGQLSCLLLRCAGVAALEAQGARAAGASSDPADPLWAVRVLYSMGPRRAAASMLQPRKEIYRWLLRLAVGPGGPVLDTVPAPLLAVAFGVLFSRCATAALSA